MKCVLSRIRRNSTDERSSRINIRCYYCRDTHGPKESGFQRSLTLFLGILFCITASRSNPQFKTDITLDFLYLRILCFQLRQEPLVYYCVLMPLGLLTVGNVELSIVYSRFQTSSNSKSNALL